MNPRILFYWLVVTIPLSWGVAQSVNAALPLFGAKSIPHFLGMPAAPTATPVPSVAPAVVIPSAIP